MHLKSDNVGFVKSILESVHPRTIFAHQIHFSNNKLKIESYEYNLLDYKHIFLIAVGKASNAMAQAFYSLLGESIAKSIIVNHHTKDDLTWADQVISTHPYVSEKSLAAGEKILHFSQKITSKDIVFVLLSGGASAMIEALPKNISLKELKKCQILLIKSGASITEINTVRKQISKIKGGKLLSQMNPAKVVTLVFSDVLGDSPNIIGSAPTVVDKTNAEDAISVLNKYKLLSECPKSIQRYLKSKIKPEKNKNERYELLDYHVLANNSTVVNKIKHRLIRQGYRVGIIPALEWDINTAVRLIKMEIDQLSSSRPSALIWGGEPTLKVVGSGAGGRAQELLLRLLFRLGASYNKKFNCFSFGSDGKDGNSPAAGAWIDNNSYNKSLKLNLNIEHYIKNNDSYGFFSKMEQVIPEMETENNLLDIGIYLQDGGLSTE